VVFAGPFSAPHQLPQNTSFLMALVNQYPSIPPAMANIVTTWAFLEEGVNHIMTKQDTPLPPFKYYSMYTVCYNYCTSVKLKDITWSGQSAAGRCPSLFISQLRRADIFRSWCQTDGFRFVQLSRALLRTTPGTFERRMSFLSWVTGSRLTTEVFSIRLRYRTSFF